MELKLRAPWGCNSLAVTIGVFNVSWLTIHTLLSTTIVYCVTVGIFSIRNALVELNTFFLIIFVRVLRIALRTGIEPSGGLAVGYFGAARDHVGESLVVFGGVGGLVLGLTGSAVYSELVSVERIRQSGQRSVSGTLALRSIDHSHSAVGWEVQVVVVGDRKVRLLSGIQTQISLLPTSLVKVSLSERVLLQRDRFEVIVHSQPNKGNLRSTRALVTRDSRGQVQRKAFVFDLRVAVSHW